MPLPCDAAVYVLHSLVGGVGSGVLLVVDPCDLPASEGCWLREVCGPASLLAVAVFASQGLRRGLAYAVFNEPMKLT